MLELCRKAVRVSTTAFDEEIQLLIDDCLLELAGLGIIQNATISSADEQIKSAIVSYVKWKYGENPDADRWEKIYNDKVSKLLTMSGYGLEGET